MRGCLTGAPARIRGLLFVLLVAAMLWIPGTVGLIASRSLDHPAVAQVGLTWWSIWLSTIWLSWFACRASGRLVPRVLRRTVGAISLASRHWIAYLVAIQDYSAFFVWTLIVYITWLAFIWSHFQGPAQQLLSPASSMIAASRFLLGLSICATLLLLEKLSIQIIAYTFHQVSYASRIAECKLHIRVLTLLFEHSRRDLTQEGIELDAEMQMAQFLGSSIKSRTGMFRQFHRRADSSKPRNNALAAAAADMAVQVIALPNAAQRIVLAALGDAEQTRHLAKRLFYSFARRDKSDRLVVRFVDFAAVLGEESFSQAAWAIFDCDGNGDLLEEEMEAACLEIRTERMSVINSVRDIDSAVATLDSMFMSCFVVISLTIIAALLSVKFANLIASFGTALLGLSWLISGGAQELLTAIVFLFIKHPYDVGDLVTIVDLKADFIVEEMKLLSTIFRTMAGEYFQISNAKLASSNGIVNTRRSGPTIEKFQLEISYATTYQQLENLRAKMLLWLAEQDRDFLPGLDIQILDMKAQGSMSVSVGIRYKSNFQDHLLKAQRRNMWLCRFKQIMAELQIEGPDAKATPPWSNSKGEAAKEAVRGGVDREYCLMDKKQDYEGTLRRRRAKPKAEHQDDEKKPTTENAPQHGLYSMPRYTPAATLARSQPSNFRRGIDDYEQHMHS
ncbi:hypothetical protein K437DRAFT_218746 [Tilletiaria anomala UBC 951]|uniref:EF-hand domain-containing protein n=1 Tax=Tilletiaria anomala (strain ATCC 24038 / CBS 436.72 / UBC 951) TaxID=1037660 RepID=A0A066WSC3_TILAU|nr:uncharacterized protein K437DRAFT_218746 [Tilletiaria anomala UBC 951]KDN53590.1 hypothetical protein K437DRAFT_218746 [Tilletiaria anomala UBC 951]